MSNYKLLIFDWDGTLCDSVGLIVDSMQVAAARCGLPQISDESIKGIIGMSLHPAIRTLYPEIGDDAAVERFHQAYVDHYMSLDVEPCPLFPGVRESLSEFKAVGYLLAVATGKARRGLDRVLRGHGLDTFFDATRAADETAGKPDPLMLKQILEHCNVGASEALMIGDASFDLLMARNAGIDCIAVGYGAQPLDFLRTFQPTATIAEFTQLRGWLNGR